MYVVVGRDDGSNNSKLINNIIYYYYSYYELARIFRLLPHTTNAPAPLAFFWAAAAARPPSLADY